MNDDLLPVRFSYLRAMAKSPSHARFAMEHDIDDTPYLRLGRLVHALTVGEFTNPVWTGDRRGNAWLKFKEEHAGADIVTDKELEQAQGMAASLARHEEASRFLSGTREKTFTFTLSGRLCRATPDAVSDVLGDLKSSSDVSPRTMSYRAAAMGYHAQLAWYKDARILAGFPAPKECAIVAVETKPPFAVAVYVLPAEAEELGRRLYRSWLEEFLNCERSGAWPGYPPGVLELPASAVELVGPDGEVIGFD